MQKPPDNLIQLWDNPDPFVVPIQVEQRHIDELGHTNNVHYLDWLLRRYGDDAVLALAGYNAGEGAVDKYAGVPPYRETRAYVAKVAGAYAAARMLCVTPPVSARDTCQIR